MGVAKILSFDRVSGDASDVKVDRGGGDNLTGQHFSAPGDDSHPLPGDYVLMSDPRGSGRQSVSGYHDPKNLQTAAAGEKRIYSRDESGATVAEVWLKNDGSINIQSINGASVFINGVEITPDGDIKLANGVVLGVHTHAQGADSGGDTQVETDGPTT